VNPIRAFLVRVGIGSVAGPSLRAGATPHLVADPALDRPRGFGYKVNWFAVKTVDADAVLATLRFSDRRRANWASGLQFAHAPSDRSEAGDFVFITPPVDGWVFIVGSRLPYPDHSEKSERREIGSRFERIFSSLASAFPDVQFFGSHRVVDFCAWARARKGRVERVFSYADGEVYVNFGEQSAEERRLGFVNLAGLSPSEASEVLFAHAERQDAKREELVRAGWDRGAANKLLREGERCALPNEDDPLAVAAAWSVDPIDLLERELPFGVGTVARLRDTVP